jgi:hypothetical protein
MSKPLIALVTLIYFGVAVSHAVEGKWAWSLVWASYGLANIGLLLAA